ncbi:C2H2 finger domain-containing protein [Diaporthe helianthi]|uniref:C2H2 finger domain-containing protein n=1 Tax=Diaporthe helianthi TaxID=158607 RepID=A0A2P5I1U2_DIAHE|nr:C2H2 finger domain-containing protein [Diaporthe helianthi]
MSSSTYGIQPSLLDSSNGRDRIWPAANLDTVDNTYEPSSTISFGPHHLSPYSQLHKSSGSPVLQDASTPADSQSAFSEHYQSSDLSELDVDADPFFGVDFSNDGGTPSFLEDPNSSEPSDSSFSQAFSSRSQHATGLHNYPLSPDPSTPSIHATSPSSEKKSPKSIGEAFVEPVSSHGLLNPPRSVPSHTNLSRLAIDTSSETHSASWPTEDTKNMNSSSPRVTVSMWGKDQENLYSEVPESPTTVRAGGLSSDDNFAETSYQSSSVARDEHGAWVADPRTGYGGWGPEKRSTGEAVSINEQALRRKVAERNEEVGNWIASSKEGAPPETTTAFPDYHDFGEAPISSREIAMGNETENKPLPGQTYYTGGSGALTQEDIDLMRQHRVWSDAPAVFHISQDDSARQQPESSKAAMEKFEQMCQDNASILSRAATWGTRRRSLPSIADIDGITSGSFLKKLSISRERKPSVLFKEIRGFVRKSSTSQLLKRNRSVNEGVGSGDGEALDRRESQNSLAPPGRTGSWGKKQQMPSLNTALVSMAAGVATIGTSHARTSSVSNATSPKSPFNLQVRNTLRRPRSKSELPKGTKDESHPNLVGMWKKSGGPPVAQLAKPAPAADEDEDEDEDDDAFEEAGLNTQPNNTIDDVTPNFAGFRQYALLMNPRLRDQNTYLADRIAHQQVIRYKALLNNKVKHLQHISSNNCPCGTMCIALGGSANLLDTKGDGRGLDPLSNVYDGSEGDVTPLEGLVTAENFPPDIPMPPASTLPAEFECQLCYQSKKFTKPSDWTKHVHEDVQPFCCTWDRCREPKIFKRKADWVRHENEGHRHLEWWTCDVDDCRHTCYRRDNFLQHLVREHKFPEPKMKTKAAIKRAGAQDPTWQKVERCHEETKSRPQDEPCRFCGRALPTWKKLTVHLAKHMENMTLPVLRLVARKELEPDTIISPVQEPPPRTFPPAPTVSVKTEAPLFKPSLHTSHSPMQHQPGGVLAYPPTQTSPYGYQTQATFASPFYGSLVHGLPQHGATNLGIQQNTMGGSFQSQTGYQNLPATTSPFMAPGGQFISVPQHVEPYPAYMNNPLGLQDASGNQIYDTTLDPGHAGGGQHYTPQGSASPYSRSPLQGQGGFYSHQ